MLHPSTFEVIEQGPHGLRNALSVLGLGGASSTLGQSVVLVLNRVSRPRFVLALVLGGLELALEAVVWIASVWLVAGLFGAPRGSLLSAIRVISLAYAPLLLGFLVFLPMLGPPLDRLLRLWVLLAAVVGISAAFGLPPLEAAAAAAGGLVARSLLLRLVGGGAAAADRWWWRASTGRQAPFRSADALLAPPPWEGPR